MSYALIVTGGTLIFVAALLLINHLRSLVPAVRALGKPAGSGRMFYLAGPAYLLLGIIVGSGLWFGWGKALGMANLTEVHIHTNIWGFISPVLAGLIVDLAAGQSHDNLISNATLNASSRFISRPSVQTR